MLQSSFAALSTVGICATAFMGIPLTITNYRERKILEHSFTTPVNPVVLLLVQVMIHVIVCIVSAVFVYLTAKLFFGYRMLGSIPGFCGAYLLVMLSMFSLGMIIASVLPLSQGIQLLKSCSLGEPAGNMVVAVAVMVASILIGMIISAKTFRWEAN